MESVENSKGEFPTLSTALGNPAKSAGFPHFHSAYGGCSPDTTFKILPRRRLPESLRTQTLKLVQAKYSDFGPNLACEYLAKEHEVEVSKETLRQGLIGAGLRRVKRRKAEGFLLAE